LPVRGIFKHSLTHARAGYFLTTDSISVARNFSNKNGLEKEMKILLPRLILGPNYIQVRNAGHSKWANIKNTKMSKDLEKSRETSRFCQLIRVAIREKGSADPKANKQLADAIERAREARIPTAVITKVLDSSKNVKDLKNFLWHVKGPGRSVFLLEVMTDHIPKLRNEIISIIKKNQAAFADEGVMYQFDNKGIIQCSSFDGKPVTEDLLDASVAHAIEVDAEEVSLQTHPTHGNVLEFIADPVNFHKVKHALLKLNYSIVESDLHYIPTAPVQLSDDELIAATKLCDKLLAVTEIVKLSDNIAA